MVINDQFNFHLQYYKGFKNIIGISSSSLCRNKVLELWYQLPNSRTIYKTKENKVDKYNEIRESK